MVIKDHLYINGGDPIYSKVAILLINQISRNFC
ncbi:hypothetical protein QFZ77_000227 [Paenibacillus sp. V4I3]|nr:hypothetical protein [Paenibacillus sp. V4I3]